MKKIKDLQIKAEDLRKKVSTYCCDTTLETPVYGKDQASKIKEWIQSHGDILKEILKLRMAVQRTNLSTRVSIEFGSNHIGKSIAEWIHRRRDLAGFEQDIWKGIGDKNIKEGNFKTSTGDNQEVKIRRYYDPSERDAAVELYRSEPGIIDSALEVVNAVTEIVEE